MTDSAVGISLPVAQRDALLELVLATADMLARTAPPARDLLLAECRSCMEAPAEQIEALRHARGTNRGLPPGDYYAGPAA